MDQNRNSEKSQRDASNRYSQHGDATSPINSHDGSHSSRLPPYAGQSPENEPSNDRQNVSDVEDIRERASNATQDKQSEYTDSQSALSNKGFSDMQDLKEAMQELSQFYGQGAQALNRIATAVERWSGPTGTTKSRPLPDPGNVTSIAMPVARPPAVTPAVLQAALPPDNEQASRWGGIKPTTHPFRQTMGLYEPPGARERRPKESSRPTHNVWHTDPFDPVEPPEGEVLFDNPENEVVETEDRQSDPYNSFGDFVTLRKIQKSRANDTPNTGVHANESPAIDVSKSIMGKSIEPIPFRYSPVMKQNLFTGRMSPAPRGPRSLPTPPTTSRQTNDPIQRIGSTIVGPLKNESLIKAHETFIQELNEHYRKNQPLVDVSVPIQGTQTKTIAPQTPVTVRMAQTQTRTQVARQNTLGPGPSTMVLHTVVPTVQQQLPPVTVTQQVQNVPANPKAHIKREPITTVIPPVVTQNIVPQTVVLPPPTNVVSATIPQPVVPITVPQIIEVQENPVLTAIRSPSMPLPNGIASDWESRVAIQRQHNYSLRTTGIIPVTFPDQMVGFNGDGIPVDKLTTPREVWDREYSNTASQKEQSSQPYKGGRVRYASGTPGDPDDNSDSSDSSDRDKKRKSTPWSDESSDDNDKESDTDSSSNDSWVNYIIQPQSNLSKSQQRKLRRKLAAKLREKTGDDERRARWKHQVHKVYRRMIRHAVGKPVANIDGSKNIKIPSPDTYDGTPDVEIFERWLSTLLRWMAVNRYCGNDHDKTRLQVLGLFLKDKALDWYNDEVDGPHRITVSWKFEDAIIGIFDRCVQASTIHQAAQQFEQVTYSPTKGVRDYHATLIRWAARMQRPPNSAAMQDRFINGLPITVLKQLANQGIVPEYAKLRTMVKAVTRLEDNRHLEDYYVTSRKKPGIEDSKYLTKRIRRESKVQPSGSTGPYKSGPVIVKGRPFQLVKRRFSNYKAKPVRTENTLRSTGQVTNSKSSKPKPSGDASTRKLCYGCGKPGHFANDPTCERYGQPRMYVIQEEDEQEEIESPPIVEEEIQNDESPNISDPTNEESSEGEYTLEPYEDEYVGRLYDDDDDFSDYYGRIMEPVQTVPEEFEDPLADCGPPVCIEEDMDDDLFLSIDPHYHSFIMNEDRLTAISHHEDEEPKPETGKGFRTSSKQMPRPNRGPAKNRRPMTAIVNIGGVEAFTLFDSGCTIEALSPSFVRIANIKAHQLADQHSLQLGTVGSKAKFNFGTSVNTSYGDINEKVYFDIINVDRYDAILGTQFMRKHGIQLDFNKDAIFIKGKVAPYLSVGEDAMEFARRTAMKKEILNGKFRRAETQASQE
jgi:hypothetical protein